MRLPQALGFLLGPGALALTAIAGLAPSARPSGLRFSVTYKADKSKEPARRAPPAHALEGQDGRAAHADQRLDPEDPADLRRRRRRLEGRRARRRRGRRARLSGREPRGDPAGDVPGPGAAPPLRDLPSRRRPRREASDGPRRGAAVEQGARQSLLDAARDHDRGRKAADVLDRARPGHPADPRPADDEVRQARADPVASGCRSSGDARCTSARTSSCPRASTRIRTRATRSSSTTGTFPTRSAASGRRLPIRT